MDAGSSRTDGADAEQARRTRPDDDEIPLNAPLMVNGGRALSDTIAEWWKTWKRKRDARKGVGELLKQWGKRTGAAEPHERGGQPPGGAPTQPYRLSGGERARAPAAHAVAISPTLVKRTLVAACSRGLSPRTQ